MKIALITDTHAGARNDSVLFANFFRKFYENIFFPTLKERGITDVIHLGDMFDRRKFINYKTLNSWKKMFFDPLEEMGANIKIITGNHDSFYKNTLAVNSPQELTKGMDHVTVYSDPCEVSLTEDHKVLFLPWICDDNEDKSKELIEKTRTKVAFGHLQIAGIESDKGSFMMEGHSIAMFKAFQRVFSGHFHHRSITGNITYLGNPYEITWSDYNDKRGFHIYDTETMETEFIENKNNNYMFETLMDKLVDAGTSNISVVDNLFDMEDLGDDIDGIEDVEDTMSVIKNCVNGLQMENKEDLNKLMQDLYSEALTMETV
jgi:DNA repair exonuclease SbcCD nuclease subunit